MHAHAKLGEGAVQVVFDIAMAQGRLQTDRQKQANIRTIGEQSSRKARAQSSPTKKTNNNKKTKNKKQQTNKQTKKTTTTKTKKQKRLNAPMGNSNALPEYLQQQFSGSRVL